MDKPKVLAESSKLFVYSAVDSRDDFEEVSFCNSICEGDSAQRLHYVAGVAAF